jgi:hypothetical protein
MREAFIRFRAPISIALPFRLKKPQIPHISVSLLQVKRAIPQVQYNIS